MDDPGTYYVPAPLILANLQVVDPLGSQGFLVYPDNNTLRSPEGQAFLGMMWAARSAAAR